MLQWGMLQWGTLSWGTLPGSGVGGLRPGDLDQVRVQRRPSTHVRELIVGGHVDDKSALGRAIVGANRLPNLMHDATE